MVMEGNLKMPRAVETTIDVKRNVCPINRTVYETHIEEHVLSDGSLVRHFRGWMFHAKDDKDTLMEVDENPLYESTTLQDKISTLAVEDYKRTPKVDPLHVKEDQRDKIFMSSVKDFEPKMDPLQVNKDQQYTKYVEAVKDPELTHKMDQYFKTKKTEQKSTSGKRISWLWSLGMIFIAASSVMCFKLYNIELKSKSFDYNSLESDLHREVMFQDPVVDSILNNFATFNTTWEDKLKVLPFIGTPGVGKTFTLKLIKNQFGPKNFLYFEGLDFIEQSIRKLLRNLQGDLLNALLIDHIDMGDLDLLMEFLDLVQERVKTKLVVIPVFDMFKCTPDLIHMKSVSSRVMTKFQKSNLNYEFITFKTLTIDDILFYIKRELLKRNVELSRQNQIINIFKNVHVEELKCKGLNIDVAWYLNSMLNS